MSFHNSSKGSILNDSDVDQSEEGDQVRKLQRDNMGGKSLGGLSRIKSSTNMLVSQGSHGDLKLGHHAASALQLKGNRPISPTSDSEWASDLSVGDAAYPVVNFTKRDIHKFTPKQMITDLNNTQTKHYKSMTQLFQKFPHDHFSNMKSQPENSNGKNTSPISPPSTSIQQRTFKKRPLMDSPEGDL